MPATLNTFKTECGPQATHGAPELLVPAQCPVCCFFPSLSVSESILFTFAMDSFHINL